MTRAAALAAACALLPHTASGQQPPSSVPFALTRLELDLRVDYGRGAVDGTQTLHLRNISTHAAIGVPLLLNRLMTVSRATDAAGRELAVAQHIVVFQDDSIRQVTAAVVTLGRPVPPGDSVAIAVHYGGRLVGYAETGSLYIRDHVDRAFTILREDAFAFPMLGVPSWEVNRSMPRDPFTFAARITVPSELVVAMGGRALDTTRRDSLATWTYQSDGPVPFLNIAIAPYRVLDRGGVRIFHFPEDSVGAVTVERAVAGAVGRYTAWYGTPGQAPRLTVMEIPEGWGSQASLTAGIIETADAFRDRAQLYQLYHELSHVWNAPDLDRPSPRWNEGLASFLQWRMAAELDGWNGWEARLDRAEQSLKSRCEPRARCAAVPFAGYGKAGLTDLSYPVGMLMFYALYQALGAETFDRTYRDFFQRHREGGATTAELVAAFRRAGPAGERIVTDWFDTARWYAGLAQGQSVRQLLAGYTAQPGR